MSETQAPKPAIILMGWFDGIDAVTGASEYFAKQNQFEIIRTVKSTEALAALNKAERGVIIFAIKTKEELAETLRVLLPLDGMVKKGMLRALGYNRSPIDRSEKVLKEKGCSEFLDTRVNTRALVHKTERWIKFVENAWSQKDAQNSGPTRKTQKSESSHPASSNPNETTQIVQAPAIFLNTDVWYLLQPTDARRVRGIWLIDLVGPPPALGQWIEGPTDPRQKDVGTDSQKLWKFKITPSDSTSRDHIKVPDLIQETGEWHYFGRKPEFQWKTGKWQLISTEPKLEFVRPESPSESRFHLNDQRALLLAANSDYAKSWLPRFKELLEVEKRFVSETKPQTKDSYLEDSSTSSRSDSHSFDEDKSARGWNDRQSSDQNKKSAFFDKRSTPATQESDFNVHDLTPDEQREWGDLLENMGPFVHISVDQIQWIEGKFLMFDSTSCSIQLDEMDLHPGQVIHTRTEAFDKGFKIEMRGPSSIMEVSPIDDGKCAITFELPPSSQNARERIESLIESRQNSVVNFMKQAKGV